MTSVGGPDDGEREKRPGDKGYLAYWRKQMNGAGIGKLKNQGKSGRKISGGNILLVLKTYGEHANNQSGECWPSQKRLADESGTSESTVKRAQDWAIENGWMRVVAKQKPRRRGIHMVLLVGRVPESPPELAQLPVSDEANSLSAEDNSLSVEVELPVSTDGQTLSRTLISNSQVRNSGPSARAAANAEKKILVPEPPPKGMEKVYVGSCMVCQGGGYEEVINIFHGGTLSYICSDGYLVKAQYENVRAGDRGSHLCDLQVREGADLWWGIELSPADGDFPDRSPA